MLDGNGNRAELDINERQTLETQVLPTARGWVRDFPRGSNLYNHGKRTLEHWGEVAE